jgi:hypothetical protein
MSATLAPAIDIRACDVRPGDRIIADGFIGMTVDYVDEHPFRGGFVVVDYTICGGITGQRAFVAQQCLTVQRAEETH